MGGMQKNWAGNLTYRAERVARPTGLDELAEQLAAARRDGRTVRTLGSRHSFNTIADTDGILVDASALAGEVADLGDGAFRVPGGMRYGELALELRRHGRALSNLASLPHISVAGAVATGTHGSGDRTGSLASAVRAVHAVGPDGARTWRRGDDGFDGAVVSLGALGVVTALELDTEPDYEVAQHVFDGPRWDDILADLDAVTGAGTSVSLFTRWQRTDAADMLWIKQRTDTGPVDDALPARLGAVPSDGPRHPIIGVDATACTAQGGAPGPWHERLPHFRLEFTPSAGAELQTEYLVPRADAVAAIEAVRALADRIAPLLLVNEIRTVAADDLWLSSSYGTDAVGLHFTWRPDQPAVEQLLPVIEAALPASARPHWGKVFTLPDDEVRARYPRFDDFAALRAAVDPDRLFVNGFLERLGL